MEITVIASTGADLLVLTLLSNNMVEYDLYNIFHGFELLSNVILVGSNLKINGNNTDTTYDLYVETVNIYDITL